MKLNLRDPLFWLTHGLAAGALAFALYVSPVNAQMASGFGGGWVPKSGGTFVGPVTNTGQPSFLAYVTTTTTNQTGAGASYNVVFETEVFDQTSSYDNATGVFTAPVTGKYQFNVTIGYNGTTSTGLFNSIVTSNRTYRGVALSPNSYRTAGGDIQSSMSFLADMDAGDTAIVNIVGTGSAGNIFGVYGSPSPQQTVFSGFLAN